MQRIVLCAIFAIGITACDGGGGDAGSDPDTSIAEDTPFDTALLCDAGPEDICPVDAEPEDTAPMDGGADSGVDGVVPADAVEDLPPVGPPERISDNYKVRESVEQIQIWGYAPEAAFEAVDADGVVLAAGTTDYQGSLILRELPAGAGYAVRPVDDPDDYTGPLKVVSIEGSQPDEAFYKSQVLEPGFGYLYTRDGTPLSIFVSLPGPPEEGPYPTVVNYSGYSPSRPGKSLGGIAEGFCAVHPVLCDAPDAPSALIATVLGFASVGVNLRGTGCSGGAYDYFEPLQIMDGYDVVEIVASQAWVKHNHVGMVGLSFPGITQLFTAKAKPPSLAAIAPMSVIGNTTTTMVSGGIYNIGFAMEWIEMVLNKADPYAHGWIQDVVDGGDALCAENQLLHSQKLDVIQKAYDNPYYTDDVAKPLDPHQFVNQIDVPVFLVGQLQDEQTGPHFPILFDNFTAAPLRRFTMSNGVHPDGFSPQVLAEWFNFLSFYVAEEIPVVASDFYFMVPVFMQDVFGTGLELPEGRFDDYTDFEAAIADYEAEPDLRVILENGAHPDTAAGAPQGTFDLHFDAWPIPGTEASRWYFHPDGLLAPEPPGLDAGASVWEHDPTAGDRTTLPSGGVSGLQPSWDWRQPDPGKALSFVTEPLAEDMVLIGHGSVDLWLRSEADDADIEVAITEVRPDGMESYVQVGWLRASHRILLEESTELRPSASHYKPDVLPLEPDAWNLVRVELMPVSHIFRAGSQIRILVDTPGDSMARWRYLLLEYDTPPHHRVAHDAAYPSSVALPLIPGIEVPTDLPPCNALRGQPCREYVPYENVPYQP